MIDTDEAWWFTEKFQLQPPPPRRQDHPAPPSPCPSVVRSSGFPYTSEPPSFSVQARPRQSVRPVFQNRPGNGHSIRFLRQAVNAGPQKTPEQTPEPTGPCALSARHRLDRIADIHPHRIPRPPENAACTSASLLNPSSPAKLETRSGSRPLRRCLETRLTEASRRRSTLPR